MSISGTCISACNAMSAYAYLAAPAPAVVSASTLNLHLQSMCVCIYTDYNDYVHISANLCHANHANELIAAASYADVYIQDRCGRPYTYPVNTNLSRG